MTIRYHPHDEVLLSYAAGTLATAPRIVTAAHLEACAACRRRIGHFEAVGGLAVNDGAPAALAHDALARALAAIDAPDPKPEPARPHGIAPGLFPKGIEVPRALLDQKVGPWRWVAPGIQISRIEGLWHTRERGFLLKAAPGVTVPHHDHDGLELAQMLAGALIDDGERFGPGDCAQAEPGHRHRPQSDPVEGCICLIAIDGRTRPSHWSGRLIQRFIDI